MVMGKKNACLVACFICHSTAKQLAAWSYIPQNNLIQKNKIDSRRNVLAKICKWTLPVLTTTTGTFSTLPTIPVSDAYAKETTTQSTESDIATIQEATQALTNLLENWDRATIDCTYADVPRDLLEAKNKEKLLEKASEFALFDKSTSVVSCKKTNRIVRDYIGATGKGPLVGLEKKILRKGVVERVDPDLLDDYFSGTSVLIC